MHRYGTRLALSKLGTVWATTQTCDRQGCRAYKVLYTNGTVPTGPFTRIHGYRPE